MEQKMRVRMLINDFLLGGAQSVALDIVQSLDPAAFDAGIWYLRDQQGTVQKKTLHTRLESHPVPVTALNTYGFVSSIRKTMQLLRKERVQLLHCHLPVSIIVGVCAARLTPGVRVIAHHHNTDAFNSWKINLLLRIARRYADLNICYAGGVEAELFGATHYIDGPLDNLPGHSCTVTNMVDVDAITRAVQTANRAEVRTGLGCTPDTPLILMVGRMLAWKGHAFVVRAMPKILAIHPNAKLVLAGDGPERTELEELTRNLGITDRVLYVGERSDVTSLLAAADIFVSPYQYQKEATKEAIGVAILEAMAAGLPVVISNYPSARHYIEQGKDAFAIEPRDETGFAQVVGELCANPELRRTMGTSAAETVRSRFSRTNAGAIYTSMYKKLISV